MILHAIRAEISPRPGIRSRFGLRNPIGDDIAGACLGEIPRVQDRRKAILYDRTPRLDPLNRGGLRPAFAIRLTTFAKVVVRADSMRVQFP